MLILARVGRLERCCAAGSWFRCSRCATPSKADINQTTADFTGRESDACHELPGNRRTEPKCDLCQDRGPFRLFMSLPNYHPDRTRLCWHMPGVCVSQAQSSRKACQVVASCVAAGTVTARASQARWGPGSWGNQRSPRQCLSFDAPWKIVWVLQARA